MFSVNPELIQEDDKSGNAKLLRRHTYQRNGQVEDPANQCDGTFLPQGGREIEVLALMMDDMSGPHDSALMPSAMQPVVEEIEQDDGDQPAVPGVPKPDVGGWRQRVEHNDIQANLKELRDQRQQLAYQALAKTTQRIVQSIGITLPEPAVSKLGTDQNNENRKDENDDFFHSQSQQCGPAIRRGEVHAANDSMASRTSVKLAALACVPGHERESGSLPLFGKAAGIRHDTHALVLNAGATTNHRLNGIVQILRKHCLLTGDIACQRRSFAVSTTENRVIGLCITYAIHTLRFHDRRAGQAPGTNGGPLPEE